MKSLFSNPSFTCRANYGIATIVWILLAFPFVLMQSIQARTTSKHNVDMALHPIPQSKDKNAETLEPGKPIEREISGGKLHRYQISLTAGQYLRIEVMQRGIDVVLKLYASDGKRLMERDSPNGLTGPETLSYIATADGLYRFEVCTFAKTSEAGRYLLQLEMPRSPTDIDYRHVTVEQKFADATKLWEKGDKTSKIAAIEIYRYTTAEFRDMGERYWESLANIFIGRINSSIGEKKTAFEYFDRALQVNQEIDDQSLQALSFCNIGDTYSGIGEKEKSLEYYQRCLYLARATESKSMEAIALNSIGRDYESLGEYQQAMDYFKRSLILIRATGHKGAEVGILGNIARVSYKNRQIGKALEEYEWVLSLSRSAGDPSEQASILDGYATVLSARGGIGDVEKATEYYKQALNISNNIDDLVLKSMVLNNLSMLYWNNDEKREAQKYLEQSLRLARSTGDLSGEATILGNLSILWAALKNQRYAIFFGKQAINDYQQLRRNIGGLDTAIQRTFIHSKADTYRKLANLLISENRILEAQQVLDMLKEEEYFGYVRGDREELTKLANRADLRPEELQALKRYSDVADSITAIGLKFDELNRKRKRKMDEGESLTDEDEKLRQRLRADLESADRSFVVLLRQLGEEFGKDVKKKTEDQKNLQSDLNDWRKKEWGKDVVSLYTVVNEEEYRVILTTAQVQTTGKYKIRKDKLNSKISAFREAIRSHKTDVRPQAQELYNILIKPIEKDLEGVQAKTLLWSLDGTLRYLPLAALYDGKQYLVEKYQNVLLTPSSLTGKDPDRNWRGLGLGVSELPNVPAELRAVIRISEFENGALPGRRFLDSEFTEATLTDIMLRGDGNGRQYSIVHIASHFKSNPGDMTKSFLLLGDGQQLSLDKIKISRDFSFDGIELLTLSACDTAIGEIGKIDAEGIEVDSLAKIANDKGAKAVLATLWEVEDKSTSELMREFYQRYTNRNDVSKAKALQQAQLSLLRGKFAHPYFWAPFILMGDWR